MVPDSAATASAMYSGVKTTFFTMGYNSRLYLPRLLMMVDDNNDDDMDVIYSDVNIMFLF